jgi:hypothetical protein
MAVTEGPALEMKDLQGRHSLNTHHIGAPVTSAWGES